MNERWQKVQQVFHAALAKDAGERAAFLAEACRGDDRLRAEVKSLLAADHRPLTWLDLPLADAPPDFLGRIPEEFEPGQRIGAYALVRELGRGGMGTVYLAVRADDQYRQQVAIKVIRGGFDRDELLDRFRQERQILASLDHPGIARLLDAGVTRDDHPYFIMEHVEGAPIDRYCRSHQLNLEVRLGLFRRVCEAVHHAHGRLVVHCDLKPGNVLVTPAGTPKLLDFGIARVLRRESVPDPAAVSLAGSRRLTPEYASPEQARGQRLTTASDVYSLGVLLYLLLTDRQPYDLADLDLRDVQRVICERDPPAASAAAGRRRLRGDLDAIVEKALHKDPTRRYGSVEQLSEDLRRYLERWPVLARKGTFAYLADRFIRRHRLAVMAAALVVLTLLAGLGTTLRAARVATEARQAAERERATAEQVLDFIEGMFEGADPYKDRRRGLTVRELLDEGARHLEPRLANQPAARARLLRTIGDAYRHLGRYEDAGALLATSLELRQGFGDAGAPEIAASLASLCLLRRELGEYTAAEALCRRALQLRRRLAPESPEVAESINHLALLLRQEGRLENAEALYREALALNRRLRGDRHREVAINLHNLGGLLAVRGEYDEAELVLRQAVELYRDTLGEPNAHLASGLNTLGLLLKERGDFEAAEHCYRRALEMRRRVLGPEHPHVATSLSNLAALLHARGELDAAESLFRQALELSRRQLDDDHPEISMVLYHLGTVQQARGDLGAAESFFRQSLASRRQRLGHEHPAVAASALALGSVELARGRPDVAEGLLREGLEIYRHSHPADHPWSASAASLLGACLTRQGRFAEAEVLLLESYRALAGRLGRHPRTAATRERLVALYQVWDRPERAAVYQRELP